MRKSLFIAPVIALAVFSSCRSRQTVSRPPIALVDSILANPHSRDYGIISSASAFGQNSDIAIIDAPDRCLLLSESFMSADFHDNVNGAEASDGLPDFAGESIVSVMDDRYTPYGQYLGGREDQLREIAVRSFIATLDTVCSLAAFDMEGRSRKPSAKAVILSSSVMSACGRYDLDTLLAGVGVDVPVFSPVNSMLGQALSGVNSSVNVVVIASSEVIASGAYQSAFSDMMSPKGDTLSRCVLFTEPVSARDTSETASEIDLFRSVADSCRLSGLSHVNALLIDDYSVSVSRIWSQYQSVLSSDEESDMVRRQLFDRDFKIIDPRKSVVCDCYRALRQKNSFTHNIAYPTASAYITSPDSDVFTLMDFDEASLPDGVHALMLDMAPKTHKSYVQNQHFAGGN